MSSPEPERFITVGQSELIVNGTVYPLSHTGGGQITLKRPTALPTGEADFRFRLYSDDGELLSDTTKVVTIVEGSDEPRVEYRVEMTEHATAAA